jgi:8-oxo-dGTP pyrophosphatase MutT (NUDIX family)
LQGSNVKFKDKGGKSFGLFLKMDENKAHYVVATGIIVKDGKYLIAKRADYEKAFPGLWTVPGGKLEVRDYKERKQDTNAGQWYNVVEDLLRREVREEVGLEIESIKYLASLTFIRPDGVPALTLSMFAKHKTGEVKLGEGLTDYAWVDLEGAKKYNLIPGIYEEIEMLDKHLKGESLGEWGR